jgi:aldehyde:ferredoxin oxidoreductase
MTGNRLEELDSATIRQLSDLGIDIGTLVHMVQGAVAADRLNPETDLVTLAGQIARRKGAGRGLADGPLRAAARDAVGKLPALDLMALYSEWAPDTEVGSGAPRFSQSGRCSAQYRGKPGKVGYLDMSLRLLDCLGDRACAGICPATGRADLERVAELIRLNSGQTVKPRGLKTAAYRCYALERLYNLRAALIARREGRHEMTLETPGGLELSPVVWEGLDLAGFRRLVDRYYRDNGWDRKSLVKKQVLDHLGMTELWPQFR